MTEQNTAVLEFIKKYVTGRALKTDEVLYSLEGGNLEGSYADEMFFSDLIYSPTGFRFAMTTVTREKIYILDSEKKRISVKKDFTGASVFQYDIAERKSSEALTGTMRMVSSTVKDHTMEAVVNGVCGIVLHDRELRWKEQQLFYRDMPADGNIYRAVAFDAGIRFYLEDTKLRFEYTPYYYNVDPENMTREKSRDVYPVFLTKEM
ncbi:hypothetical protein K7I13_09420 [Brucepastera parasyntrophica]|uniref:hypothetical protein n=1 Tax=Brucepastera parasyntrophica TaxID=2880008 RepID=UPI00210BAF11|nr:hypothetical protein [Brucepastera parasyntrophica]ULQ58768.1 hypothetical protein K7I13_09420 [Brucepastera parasyntrophica]